MAFFERFEVRLVDGREYNSATKLGRRNMLPNEPGIYVWTTQLAHVWENISLDVETLSGAVNARLQPVREAQFDEARVGRYRRVKLFDDPVGLTTASTDRLRQLLSASDPNIVSWALMCATLFQRPLYVGKALNFRNRIRDHFDYKTRFSRTLREFGISTTDCSVTLCPVTPAAPPVEDDSEDDSDESILSAGSSETDPDSADGEDSDEEPVTPGREDLDRLIRLAESLVIRTLHPTFNHRMD